VARTNFVLKQQGPAYAKYIHIELT
jgi:hypothetical protein